MTAIDLAANSNSSRHASPSRKFGFQELIEDYSDEEEKKEEEDGEAAGD